MSFKNLKDKFCNLKKNVKFNRWWVITFLFSFALMLTFVDVTLNRNAVIRSFKFGIGSMISDLNEVGIDVAYDDIEFDNIFIFPLLKIKNLSVYNLKGEKLWNVKIEKIFARPSFWGNRKIKFSTDGNISLIADNKNWQINTDETEMILRLNKNYKFNSFELYLNNVVIKDVAKVKKIVLALRGVTDKVKNNILPLSMEGHLEINNVQLNGLLDYPLTSNIRRIYTNLNLWGNFDDNEGMLLGAENWLKSGGFIDVSSLMISWDPLLLVGRGDVHFNENFEPKVSLHTSSKALFNLLNDLQNKKYLERKGVFVANILLGAKAFKSNEKDEHYIVTTPITYRDKKLSVENITVKNFNRKN